MVWQNSHGVASKHTVYSLVGCPAPKSGSWILVRREADGSRHKLAAGRMENSAPSCNLAVIRFYGAQLGANEVHLDGPVERSQSPADASHAHAMPGAAFELVGVNG